MTGIDGRETGRARRAAGELAEKMQGNFRRRQKTIRIELFLPVKNQSSNKPIKVWIKTWITGLAGSWQGWRGSGRDECGAKIGKMPEMTSPTYPYPTPALPPHIPLQWPHQPPDIIPPTRHHPASSLIILHSRYFFAPNPLISLFFLTEMMGLALMTWVITKGHVTGMLRAC